MGGFFGAVSRESVISDVFFGTDYHSHLGTKSAGMAAFDAEIGLQRNIHPRLKKRLPNLNVQSALGRPRLRVKSWKRVLLERH